MSGIPTVPEIHPSPHHWNTGGWVPGDEPTPLDDAGLNEQVSRLLEALRVLSDKDRAAIQCVTFECRSIAECAEALGCSCVALAQRLTHGVKRLSRVLDDASPYCRRNGPPEYAGRVRAIVQV